MLGYLLLVMAVSMDGFAAALGMGSSGIKIPLRSALIISFTGTLFLGVSVAFGDAAESFIPETVGSAASFLLLTGLGMFNIFRDRLKNILSRSGKGGGSPVMMLFDGTAADKDNSKSISAKEAAALSVALSADSAITGVSTGLGEISLPLLLIMTFAAGLVSVTAGQALGRKAASAMNMDLGKLCGLILIVLAFVR